jgi:hypothetical protein
VPTGPSWQDIIEAIGGQIVGWSTLAHNPGFFNGAFEPEPASSVAPTPIEALVADESNVKLEPHGGGTHATPRLPKPGSGHAVLFLVAALGSLANPDATTATRADRKNDKKPIITGELHDGSR